MPRNRSKAILGGETRAKYGVTVSASTDDGRRTTLAEGGNPLSALRQIVFQLDHLPGRWYVDAISTPQTIFDDIRNSGRGREGDYRWYRERQWLGKIGRLDLLRVPRMHEEHDHTKPSGHAWRTPASTFRRQAKFRKRKAAEGGDAP